MKEIIQVFPHLTFHVLADVLMLRPLIELTGLALVDFAPTPMLQVLEGRVDVAGLIAVTSVLERAAFVTLKSPEATETCPSKVERCREIGMVMADVTLGAGHCASPCCGIAANRRVARFRIM
jgi:hypothetical protein